MIRSAATDTIILPLGALRLKYDHPGIEQICTQVQRLCRFLLEEHDM